MKTNNYMKNTKQEENYIVKDFDHIPDKQERLEDMIDEEDYRKELSIEIFYSELNDGWIYNIYNTNSRNEKDSGDSLDGGLCSTTMENALEMAYEMAKKYTI